MKITLIGPPGCGKGTQATLLKKNHAEPHVSSGDVLRAEVAQGTAFGKQIRQFMERGEIGPVELITEVMLGHLDARCREGFILDGFPRTLYQAEALAAKHAIDAAIGISVGEPEIIRRITGRRVCGGCKTNYHIAFNPPRTPDTCDRCGERLIQRSDDNEETARNRIRIFNEETRPVLDYYERQGLLYTVDGEQPVGAVQEAIARLLLPSPVSGRGAGGEGLVG